MKSRGDHGPGKKVFQRYEKGFGMKKIDVIFKPYENRFIEAIPLGKGCGDNCKDW